MLDSLTQLLLRKLQTLALNNNEFTGPLPSEIGQLWNLGTCRVGYSCVCPPHLSFLTQGCAEFFYLDNNMFTGEIPSEVCNLWGVRLRQFGPEGGECGGPRPFGGLQCPSSECCRTCANY